MDRLLCGDVGYGKTEVAMRAAFKAVMDGKQVAFLAPTTVLAFQHLKTLRDRFSGFPVTIDMMVEVIHGPLKGVVGRLLRKNDKARLVLSVDLIGQAVSVEVDAADVRAY